MKKNKRINLLTGTLLTSILILIMGCQSSSELIPITGACCANVENKIYVVGGITKNGKTTNILQEYDPSMDTWKNKTPMPTPRAMSSAVAIGNKIYVFGGRNESGITNKVEVYDTGSDSWTRAAEMPDEKWNHMVAVVDGKIYVIGGITGTGSQRKSTGSVDVYDPAGDSWESGSGMLLSRQGAAIAVLQDRIYVIGGRIGTSATAGKATNRVDVYDPSEDSWTSETQVLGKRTMARAVKAGNKIYLIGGAADNDLVSTIEMYDPDSDVSGWSVAKIYLQQPRTGHCVASLGNEIYVIGGNSSESLSGILGNMEVITLK